MNNNEVRNPDNMQLGIVSISLSNNYILYSHIMHTCMLRLMSDFDVVFYIPISYISYGVIVIIIIECVIKL